MKLNRRRFLTTSAAAATAGLASPHLALASTSVRWNWIAIQPLSQPFLAKIADGFKRIEERTEGNFAVQHGNITETPFKANEGLSLIRDGLADVMEWYPGYVSNTYPMLVAPELPFIMPEYWKTEQGVKSSLAAMETPTVKAAYDKVLGDHGATKGLRVIWEPISIWSNKEEMSPIDLKGGVYRANTRETADLIAALGGVAEFMSITDVYLSLQRNAVQGFSGSTASVMTYKLFEVLKSGVLTNNQYTSGTFLVRQAAVDALPDELRKIYDEEMAATQQKLNNFTIVSESAARKKAEEAGLSVRDVTTDEYARLRETAQNNVWSSWKERAGADGATALEEVTAAIASV